MMFHEFQLNLNTKLCDTTISAYSVHVKSHWIYIIYCSLSHHFVLSTYHSLLHRRIFHHVFLNFLHSFGHLVFSLPLTRLPDFSSYTSSFCLSSAFHSNLFPFCISFYLVLFPNFHFSLSGIVHSSEIHLLLLIAVSGPHISWICLFAACFPPFSLQTSYFN